MMRERGGGGGEMMRERGWVGWRDDEGTGGWGGGEMMREGGWRDDEGRGVER